MRPILRVRSSQLMAAVAFLLVPATAWRVHAHGVQYQLSYDTVTGKIQTREIVSTNSTPATLGGVKRIYVMPFNLANSTTPAAHPAAQPAWYSQPDITNYPSGNGICYQWDATAGGGMIAGTGWAWKDSATLPNLAGTAFGYQFADRLLKWDGSAFTSAAAGVTQLQAFRGDATTVPPASVTTAPGSVLNFNAVSSSTRSTNPHANAGFRLLGDGTSFDPAAAGPGTDGIYLQGLRVTSNAAGVTASDPAYMIFYKNTPFAEALTVAASFAAAEGIPANQIQAVPEPGALVLAGIGAALAAVSVARHGRRWLTGRIG